MVDDPLALLRPTRDGSAGGLDVGQQRRSPEQGDDGDAHIAANHAYSILGTWETNNRRYVILRSPWGWCEAALNSYAGTWTTPESWGNADMTVPGDGVFALEIHTFREYYMGFGGASSSCQSRRVTTGLRSADERPHSPARRSR